MPKWIHCYSCLGNCLSCLCAKYCLFMCHPILGGDFSCGSCKMPLLVYSSFMIITIPLSVLFFFIGLMIDIFGYYYFWWLRVLSRLWSLFSHFLSRALLWVVTGGCFCCCCPPVFTTDFAQAVSMRCVIFPQSLLKCFYVNTEATKPIFAVDLQKTGRLDGLIMILPKRIL